MLSASEATRALSRRPQQERQSPPPTATPPCDFLFGPSARPCIPRAVVLPRPLQHLQAPGVSGACTSRRIPRAEVLPHPLQHLQVPTDSGYAHVISFHGESCSRSHFNTSRCPPAAAHVQQFNMHSPPSSSTSTHGHPCSHAHINTSRCPPAAAFAHVLSSQSQPCPRAHLSTYGCPLRAAIAHVAATHGQSFVLAQASRWTDPHSSFSLSGPPPFAPARGRLCRVLTVLLTVVRAVSRAKCIYTFVLLGLNV